MANFTTLHPQTSSTLWLHFLFCAPFVFPGINNCFAFLPSAPIGISSKLSMGTSLRMPQRQPNASGVHLSASSCYGTSFLGLPETTSSPDWSIWGLATQMPFELFSCIGCYFQDSVSSLPSIPHLLEQDSQSFHEKGTWQIHFLWDLSYPKM